MQTEVAAKSSKFFNAVTGIQDCWVEMDWDVHSWVPLVRPPSSLFCAIPPAGVVCPCTRVPGYPGARVPGRCSLPRHAQPLALDLAGSPKELELVGVVASGHGGVGWVKV